MVGMEGYDRVLGQTKRLQTVEHLSGHRTGLLAPSGAGTISVVIFEIVLKNSAETSHQKVNHPPDIEVHP